MFRDPTKKGAGYKSFVVDGWNCWNNKDRLKEHVGGVGSPHNVALKKCEVLLKKNNTLMLLYANSSSLLRMHIMFDSMVPLILLDCY